MKRTCEVCKNKRSSHDLYFVWLCPSCDTFTDLLVANDFPSLFVWDLDAWEEHNIYEKNTRTV